METKLYELYKQAYPKNEYITTCTGEELNKFIAKQTGELNYGIFRTWAHDKKSFYDCGPVVYYTIEIEKGR